MPLEIVSPSLVNVADTDNFNPLELLCEKAGTTVAKRQITKRKRENINAGDSSIKLYHEYEPTLPTWCDMLGQLSKPVSLKPGTG